MSLLFENSSRFCEAFPKLFTKEICYRIMQKSEDAWFYWIKHEMDTKKFFMSIWLEDKISLYKWISLNSSTLLSNVSNTEYTDEELESLELIMNEQELKYYLDPEWITIALMLWEQGNHNIKYVIQQSNYRISCTLRLLI